MKNRKPRKDGRYVVPVSFTDAELDILSFADTKGSFSSYVKYLIRLDMAGQIGNTLPPMTRTTVAQEVASYIEDEVKEDIKAETGTADGSPIDTDAVGSILDM